MEINKGFYFYFKFFYFLYYIKIVIKQKLNIMNTYKITNIGEGNATIIKELTEEQYEFLNNLFDELNDAGEPYAPYISIYVETDFNVDEEDDFDEDVDW